MKAVIWIGCIFSLSLFIVILKYSGITLGGIPTGLLFGGMLCLRDALYKKWDHHRTVKGEYNGKN